MVELNKEAQEKIQELQALEQNFQALLIQKQTFQIENNETKTALEEIEKTKSDVFRVIGQIMVKSDKKALKKELSEKNDLIKLRVTSIEKQENELRIEIERLRNEIMNGINQE